MGKLLKEMAILWVFPNMWILSGAEQGTVKDSRLSIDCFFYKKKKTKSFNCYYNITIRSHSGKFGLPFLGKMSSHKSSSRYTPYHSRSIRCPLFICQPININY